MSKSKIESRSLQLFPSGKSVNVQGQYPEFKVRFDYRGRWKKADAKLADEIQANELALVYIERDILANQCALITDLMRSDVSGFGIEDVENYYTNPENWTVQECYDFLGEHGEDFPEVNPFTMTREQLTETLNDVSIDVSEDDTDDVLLAAVLSNIDDGTIDGLEDWKQKVNENSEAAEIYEWYLVTDWLAGKLKAEGEAVLDNDYGYWWGRQCTGQMIVMDGLLQRIAHKIL